MSKDPKTADKTLSLELSYVRIAACLQSPSIFTK